MTADEAGKAAARANIRCSDAERETAVAALQKAAGEGRLSLTEVEERTTAVYEARYRHELAALLADLPAPAAPTTGWRPVLTLAGRQFATDLGLLTGRTGTAALARRRAFLLVAAVFVLVLTLLLAVHGVATDGLHHHPFGHD
ncbi:DUF1707 domain-containing protein [Amycolatopsis rhabdoformis]|uniref:DUF1707 domain-containing protein n=1 Tax=Amycolatopsis rhabdoformis TaxID=1448059 RepID=A0ABZ1IGN4_9PSEU|nr:DUF1707 domain-containing protein [Amycolatopsis rhabdoformis]WSE33630.1 DUF1707 domain-containing protein [Amycolatopsis rhabdoformis]